MRAAIAAAKRPANVLSAQDSIPFERMFPDGICRVEGNFYSKTIAFQDINYQLSQSEDKDAIFDGWCEFLNYFDASVRFQFSFVNSAANKETYRERIVIPLRGDEDDSLDFIEYECPHCGASVYYDQSAFDLSEEHPCPSCGKELFPETPDEDE